MKMVKTKLALGAAVAALALSAGAANAAVNFVGYQGGPHPQLPVGQAVVVDFDNAPVGGYTWSGTGTIESPPPVDGEYAVPNGDGSDFAVVKPGQTGTLTHATGMRALSVYIGSLDTYNAIEFFAGGISVGKFGLFGTSLEQFGAQATQSHTGAEANGRFFFEADAGTYFDEVQFTSANKSIEFDTITAAVPEPGTWALMIAGFGLLGSALRRRRTVVGAVA